MISTQEGKLQKDHANPIIIIKLQVRYAKYG